MPRHRSQRAAGVRGHGHRHRVAARHRDGAGGRHRVHPQEPLDRRPGRSSGQGEAQRGRDDCRPGHDTPRPADPRSAPGDGALQDLGRPRHGRGGQASRDPHEPGLAVRGGARPADRRAHDEGEPRHRARGHDARRGEGPAPPPPDREAARRGRVEQPQGADHRQGHPEEDRVSPRLQGRPRPVAGRRGGGRIRELRRAGRQR